MKKLELKSFGLEEMNQNEMLEIEGGDCTISSSPMMDIGVGVARFQRFGRNLSHSVRDFFRGLLSEF